jgi:benzodiazapine receptor
MVRLQIFSLFAPMVLAFTPSAAQTMLGRGPILPRHTPMMLLGATPGTAVAWIMATQAAGASGAVFVVKNLDPWYASLSKPSWSPPDRVFAPVWVSLYTLIGLACARTLGPSLAAAPQRALQAFALQEVFNLLWAPTFFGAHRLRLGFMVSCALLTSATWAAVEFGAAASALSAALLLPYIAWLTFATALNLRLWQLNGPTA